MNAWLLWKWEWKKVSHDSGGRHLLAPGKKSSATLSSPGCRARLPSVRKKRGPVRVSSWVLPAPGPGLSRDIKNVSDKKTRSDHSHPSTHTDMGPSWIGEKNIFKISIFSQTFFFALVFHWYFFQTRAWSSLMLLTGTRLRRRPSSITRTRPRPWTCTPPWSSPSSSCSSSCPSSAPSPPSTCSPAQAEVRIPRRTYFELWPVT